MLSVLQKEITWKCLGKVARDRERKGNEPTQSEILWEIKVSNGLGNYCDWSLELLLKKLNRLGCFDGRPRGIGISWQKNGFITNLRNFSEASETMVAEASLQLSMRTWKVQGLVARMTICIMKGNHIGIGRTQDQISLVWKGGNLCLYNIKPDLKLRTTDLKSTPRKFKSS